MNKIIVITGATSGIGKKLKEFYKSDKDIVISLSRTEQQTPTSFPCDISDPLQLKKAFDFISQQYGKIDILINNAGYGLTGATELISLDNAKNLFDVNFFGALNCIKMALPLMDNKSKIFNISSACALFPLPYRTLYCASKSAMNMLSLCIQMELKPYGIDVVSICPGDIKTNFSPNRVKNYDTNKRYENRIKNATDYIENREDKRMSIDKATKKIYKIMNKKNHKPQYIVGLKYKFFYFASKILPLKLFNKIIAIIFDGK